MNYLDLLNIKYKTFKIIIISFIFSIITIINILNISIYDVINIYGYVCNNKVIIKYETNLPDTNLDIDYIKINDTEYKNINYSKSELLLDKDNFTNYYNYTLNINHNYKENQILKITIYYNKERISKKLQKLFF